MQMNSFPDFVTDGIKRIRLFLDLRDVDVGWGAAQPGYDLRRARHEGIREISVRGGGMS